jgi:hypothetical protein
MRLRKKPLPGTAPGNRVNCEAFRFGKILYRLRSVAAFGSLADANYELLKRDPRHPSLRFKKIGRYWSVRVGLRHRALAVEVDEGYLWFWIGSHAEYDRLIG